MHSSPGDLRACHGMRSATAGATFHCAGNLASEVVMLSPKSPQLSAATTGTLLPLAPQPTCQHKIPDARLPGVLSLTSSAEAVLKCIPCQERGLKKKKKNNKKNDSQCFQTRARLPLSTGKKCKVKLLTARLADAPLTPGIGWSCFTYVDSNPDSRVVSSSLPSSSSQQQRA